MIKTGTPVQVIDTRITSQFDADHVDTAMNLSHSKIRETMDQLDINIPVVTYCNKGVTGNAVQNILLGHGFKEVYNLSGGHKFYKSTIKKK
jgi:rhodanese-related sulfurtransferase